MMKPLKINVINIIAKIIVDTQFQQWFHFNVEYKLTRYIVVFKQEFAKH